MVAERVMPNRSVNADAQSRPAAAPRRSMVAGYVRRWVSQDVTPMRYAMLLACLAISANLNAAGFDCSKAKLPVEKLICSNAALSELDDELNEVFIDDNDLMISQQRAWLDSRNRCSDTDCLRQSYEKRILELACTGRNRTGAIGAVRCSSWELVEAERKLHPVEKLYAKNIIFHSENSEHAKNVAADESKAWRHYRSAYCALLSEAEGWSSPAYADASSLSCAVEETKRRIESLKQKIDAQK